MLAAIDPIRQTYASTTLKSGCRNGIRSAGYGGGFHGFDCIAVTGILHLTAGYGNMLGFNGRDFITAYYRSTGYKPF